MQNVELSLFAHKTREGKSSHTNTWGTISPPHPREALPGLKAERKANASEVTAKLMPVAIPCCPLAPSHFWFKALVAEQSKENLTTVFFCSDITKPHFKLWQTNYRISVKVIYFSEHMPQGYSAKSVLIFGLRWQKQVLKNMINVSWSR